MTEETRKKLRELLAGVVTAIELPDAALGGVLDRPNIEDGYVLREWGVSVHVVAAHDTDGEPPPLTTAQQLALSVLVGEPDRVVLSALCDLLIDMGHEYAVAVAEKARREERRRIVGLIRAWADDAYDAGEAEQSEMLTALVEVVEE